MRRVGRGAAGQVGSGPTELRRTFHDRLAGLHDTVGAMVEHVARGIPTVTDALLEGDAAAAASVVAADAELDAAYARVEAEVFDLVARQGPMGRDVRFLIASLRVAQEAERSGDLAASVGRRVPGFAPDELAPTVRALLYELGAETTQVFDGAARAYRVLDEGLAQQVVAWDDGVDDLHRRLLGELFVADRARPETLVELGLIARFYERIADHAVVVCERVRFVAVGDMRPGDSDESS